MPVKEAGLWGVDGLQSGEWMEMDSKLKEAVSFVSGALPCPSWFRLFFGCFLALGRLDLIFAVLNPPGIFRLCHLGLVWVVCGTSWCEVTGLVAQHPGSMRGLHLVLLAVLLCSDHALSLQCYLCAGAQTAAQCPIMSCGQGQNVCYKGDLIATLHDGKKESVKLGGCAPSCELASNVMQATVGSGSGPNTLEKIIENMGLPVSKIEVQNMSCCEKDLCNGVSRAGRSLWALSGGLLLSLGPALLWALL